MRQIGNRIEIIKVSRTEEGTRRVKIVQMKIYGMTI